MAEKDLRKMRRSELIEIIYALKTREEQLEHEVTELKEQLENRKIQLSHAGSIAEAALALNRVFEAAQAAADDYLHSIRGEENSECSATPASEKPQDLTALSADAAKEADVHEEAKESLPEEQEMLPESIRSQAEAMKEYVAFYDEKGGK